MNVRAFTADESSGLDQVVRGSYLGVIEKVRVPILWFAHLFLWSLDVLGTIVTQY